MVVAGFRVDAIEPDGTLVEVQSAALGPLRGKLSRLLPTHRVRVVKPMVVARRIVRRARPGGPDLGARLSPCRGAILDVFDDLVGLATVFPHPNLRVDVLGVAIDEVRIPRGRRPGYGVVDRRLREVVQTAELRVAVDLWDLLPEEPAGTFTTRDLAEIAGRSEAFAQRVAYGLRLSGAAEVVGKRGNRLVYQRLEVAAGSDAPPSPGRTAGDRGSS